MQLTATFSLDLENLICFTANLSQKKTRCSRARSKHQLTFGFSFFRVEKIKTKIQKKNDLKEIYFKNRKYNQIL